MVPDQHQRLQRLFGGPFMAESPAVNRVWSYEKEPYRRALETAVLALGREKRRPFVLLQDTIFYPGGGGQPPDRGWVNESAVLDIQRTGSEIRHYLETPVAPGPVSLKLDWPRRFDHMQQHTAQHVLTAVALELFGWRTTAFHLGEARCDIELDTSAITGEELEALEEAVAAQIRAGLRVSCRRVSPEEYSGLDVRSRGLPAGHRGMIRLVEIAGVDLNTCGGTHVASTAEIEGVKLLDTESMRRATRLHWLAGGRMRRLLAAHEERNARLRSLFECCDGELVDVAASRIQGLKENSRRTRFLEQRLAESAAAAMVAGGGRLAERHFEGLGAGYLRSLAGRIVELDSERAVFLTSSSEGEHFFLLAAGERCPLDVQAMGRRVAERLQGRGGGPKGQFQGKAGSLEGRQAALMLLARQLAHDRA